MKYAYFGHHKAASQWFTSIIQSVCIELSISYKYMAIEQDRIGTDLSQFDFIADVNASYSRYKDIDDYQGIHVIRDPRDIIVSGYFSHKYSHPTNRWNELVKYREILNTCDVNEGLIHEIEFSKQFLSDIADWKYDKENILELKYEEVTTNQFDSWLAIFIHLGLIRGTSSVKKDRVLAHLFIALNAVARKIGIGCLSVGESVKRLVIMDAVFNNQFKFKSASSVASEGKALSHYRKGLAGDWRNYFTRKHAERFVSVYGDLLVRLGYENDSDWIQDLPQ